MIDAINDVIIVIMSPNMCALMLMVCHADNPWRCMSLKFFETSTTYLFLDYNNHLLDTHSYGKHYLS
jgi:dipeptide/tripeptide permease